MTTLQQDTFANQVFRRIGFTVGLWKLARFTDLCVLLAGRRVLDRRELVRNVRTIIDSDSKRIGTSSKEAEGKVDVARSLGLVFNIGMRYSLTAQGRALAALAEDQGRGSREVWSVLLRQVVASDGDISLTLLLNLKGSVTADQLGNKFIESLAALLVDKRKAYGESPLPHSTKRRIPHLLAVRDSKPVVHRQSAVRSQVTTGPIEIEADRLEHYIRHTVGPRRGWLDDLELTESRELPTEFGAVGRGLVKFLREKSIATNSYVLLDPDEDVLMRMVGRSNIVSRTPINEHFFSEMVSYAYSGGAPAPHDMEVSEFLELLEDGYRKVKLEGFEQADTRAVRMVVLSPMLIRGKTIDFDRLLTEAVRTYPDRVYRLSSRREAGAYISFKRPA